MVENMPQNKVVVRIAELERRLADAQARLPRHSVPAAMLIEIEDLEDELVRLKEAVQERGEEAG